MAVKKNSARQAALKEFVKQRGKVTMKALSEKLGVSVSQLGRWKKADDWDDVLKKKCGAPDGNKNAAGAGAPRGNKNAEKHGAYSSVCLDDLSPERRESIEAFSKLAPEQQLAEELKKLLAKELDLEERAKAYRPVVQDGQVFDFLVEDKEVRNTRGDGAFERSIHRHRKSIPFDRQGRELLPHPLYGQVYARRRS